MTESSLPWTGTVTGDAGPYSASAWSFLVEMFTNTDPNYGGVLWGLLAENPAGTTVRVSNGRAVVRGKFYVNTDWVSWVLDIPAVSTRKDRIVLRRTLADQEVRLTYLKNPVEGTPGYVAMTQDVDTVWDIPLWNIDITTGGVITLTSAREQFRSFPMAMDASLAAPWDVAANCPNPATWYDIDDMTITFKTPRKCLLFVYLTLTYNGKLTDAAATVSHRAYMDGAVATRVYTDDGNIAGGGYWSCCFTWMLGNVTNAAHTIVAQLNRSAIPGGDAVSLESAQMIIMPLVIQSSMESVF